MDALDRFKRGIPRRLRRADRLPVPARRAAIEPVPTSSTRAPATEAAVPAELVEPAAVASGDDSGIPRGLQIAAGWAWRLLLVGVLVYFIGWGIRFLSEVMVPLAVATLLAALLFPVAHRLRTWGVHRGLAAGISVIGGLALVFGTLTLVATQIASQSSQLASQVITGFNQLLDWLANSPLHVNKTRLNDYVNQLQDFLTSSESQIATYVAEIGAQVGHFVAGFAIVIFTLFYFLYDGRRVWTFLLNFVPKQARARTDHSARRGWTSLVSYVRATILVALMDAIGVLIVALILQVPVAPALATLVFLGAFIPLVGAFISGFVAVVVALVALGWVQALVMLAGIVAVMQLEGHILQPFLLGRAVRLHPLAVLLAIATGVIVGGIVGALMAVPFLAFTKTFIQDLVATDGDPALITDVVS
ncbi:AI-2E family transporter [Microlunatus panaciterrae]|uniref:PurR-regulated permease PerM n=1 Tax=Microlunatus panaciterrae TaxID=400768 RepID=A0ABS2RIH4_9ACTN|nr:AI-2E family transporter [Microlunatus panaciterrae]MBM7798016.1 putative PurR-regulated permease PerM [Microlunatus panaciterrae]